jgi:hypothetical protein
MAAKSRASGAQSRPRSRRSRSRTARALTGLRWSGSGLPCDHGRTSCRARATRRYVANDGARNVILNAFSVRAAPGRFIRCRCSAIQNSVQTNTYDPRRPGATQSLLSCRRSQTLVGALVLAVVMSGLVDSGRKSGHGNIDADDPSATLALPTHCLRCRTLKVLVYPLGRLTISSDCGTGSS